MAANKPLSDAARAAFDRLVAQADGDARKLAALAAMALWNGPVDRAYALARRARALAPADRDIEAMTDLAFTRGVPDWHFKIVKDERRNQAYDAALRRAVRPGMRVLDIGSGTGLLAMMAARAGAEEVVSCEMNPAVADAAAEIVALNGYADRVRIVAKHSRDLDVRSDMGGQADLLVSELISADMLGEGMLGIAEDASRRLLNPGAAMIPRAAQVMVALAHWEGLSNARLGEVDGFDMRPFNRLHRAFHRLKADDPTLALRSDPAVLFDFDFASGGPFAPGRATLGLVADSAPVNGIAQWIRIALDEEIVYENRPATGDSSCWAVLFHPFEVPAGSPAGATIRVAGAHSRTDLWVWIEA